MDAVRVVAEPRRRAILWLIWDEELSAGEIAERFDVTFGAVSQHLRVLRDAGLVTLRQEGRKRYYRADRDAMGPLATYLQAMWAERLDALAELAERAERAERAAGTEDSERAERPR
ncbi:metalloregulator ArsR/SmtB family transcription factor [Streptomyces sp. CB03911]|uniref:ArsR/SmtB family transcription factor n=1 Tax=Streptomyces sp. CB03911 TaxID=1804758 RepID=UPI00093C9251|nr:metalloregulator ArsR/SmtB family transcription factor [Streptomyces sp. CB03911]OKI30696.1 transcriptional regulator [Streptomyces sp. CB03911]